MSLHRIALALFFVAACGVSTVMARPSIRILPSDAARFVKDQRFDIRVEFSPTAGRSLASVSLSVDGSSRALTLASLDATGGF
ncbi:MAG TPA: hypothetical protein PLF26_13235, partial [Blastocatellia bacterium]|nr:hypothetical protein [Blastocatellia bacterium]